MLLPLGWPVVLGDERSVPGVYAAADNILGGVGKGEGRFTLMDRFVIQWE